jgi:hypothetical protein
MKRQVKFYKTIDGKCPVQDFLDTLPAKVAAKIAWVFAVIQDLDIIPKNYFKKIKGSDIYECRIILSGNIYRF